jgi:predicted DNA-binding protein
MSTTRVNFRIPEELIEKADVAAKITHKNRTEIVIEALRMYLQDIEDEDAFKEDVIELYLDGQIGFETLTEFIGRQDAESVRASKTLLDQGDELADELAELP